MSFSRAICARPILARRERKALYPLAVPPHCSALASGLFVGFLAYGCNYGPLWVQR